jgi:hypothetical protein
MNIQELQQQIQKGNLFRRVGWCKEAESLCWHGEAEIRVVDAAKDDWEIVRHAAKTRPELKNGCYVVKSTGESNSGRYFDGKYVIVYGTGTDQSVEVEGEHRIHHYFASNFMEFYPDIELVLFHKFKDDEKPTVQWLIDNYRIENGRYRITYFSYFDCADKSCDVDISGDETNRLVKSVKTDGVWEYSRIIKDYPQGIAKWERIEEESPWRNGAKLCDACGRPADSEDCKCKEVFASEGYSEFIIPVYEKAQGFSQKFHDELQKFSNQMRTDHAGNNRMPRFFIVHFVDGHVTRYATYGRPDIWNDEFLKDVSKIVAKYDEPAKAKGHWGNGKPTLGYIQPVETVTAFPSPEENKAYTQDAVLNLMREYRILKDSESLKGAALVALLERLTVAMEVIATKISQ